MNGLTGRAAKILINHLSHVVVVVVRRDDEIERDRIAGGKLFPPGGGDRGPTATQTANTNWNGTGNRQAQTNRNGNQNG